MGSGTTGHPPLVKLLYLSTLGFQCFWSAKMPEDFADDVAFQTPDDLALAFACDGAFGNVALRSFV